MFAWLAELYAEAAPRELREEELTSGRRASLLEILRGGDPPLELFPWQRGHVERVISWRLIDRGERAQLFGASVLAEAASEGGSAAGRYAREALRLCFEEEPQGPVPDLDAGRRAIVAALSTRDYPDVAFARFGLPVSRTDRLRWLGLAPTTVLERPIDGVPLWKRLVDERGTPGPESLPRSRAAVLAEIDARSTGTDRLEALVLVASGAHGLRDVVRAADLYPALDALGPVAADWARARLPILRELVWPALRNSGAGMALSWAMARTLPANDMLPPEHDDLITLRADPAIVRTVLERLPPDRREAILLPMLRRLLASPWNADVELTRMLEVSDLVTTDAIAAAVRKLADAMTHDSLLARMRPDDARALRERIYERFG